MVEFQKGQKVVFWIDDDSTDEGTITVLDVYPGSIIRWLKVVNKDRKEFIVTEFAIISNED